MLKEITWQQFHEWQVYSSLEPWQEERMDYRFAGLCALIANVNRGKGQSAYKAEDFVMKFGEENQKPKQKSWQEVFAVGRQWAVVANTIDRIESQQRDA